MGQRDRFLVPLCLFRGNNRCLEIRRVARLLMSVKLRGCIRILSEEVPVQGAVLNGFGQMGFFDKFCTIQIGDCPGNL